MPTRSVGFVRPSVRSFVLLFVRSFVRLRGAECLGGYTSQVSTIALAQHDWAMHRGAWALSRRVASIDQQHCAAPCRPRRVARNATRPANAGSSQSAEPPSACIGSMSCSVTLSPRRPTQLHCTLHESMPCSLSTAPLPRAQRVLTRRLRRCRCYSTIALCSTAQCTVAANGQPLSAYIRRQPPMPVGRCCSRGVAAGCARQAVRAMCVRARVACRGWW